MKTLTILTLSLLFLLGCTKPAPIPPKTITPKSYIVIYQTSIQGGNCCGGYYINENNIQHSFNTRSFEYDFKAQSGFKAYISAFAGCGGNGTANVLIYVNDSLIKFQRDSASYILP